MVLFMVYTLFMLVTSTLTSLVFLVLSLEVMSWVFIKFLPSWSLMKYLMLQSVVFTILMMASLWFKPILLLGILLKMGLPPFHLWVVRFLEEVKHSAFIFFLTMHKLIPLIFLMKMVVSMMAFALSVGLALLVGMFVMNLGTMLSILIFSSMLHNFWMIFSMSLTLMFFYWSVYSFLVLLMVKVLNSLVSNFCQNSLSSVTWLLFSGIPPFTVFWLKAYVVSILVMSLNALVAISVSVLSILILSSYYRVWHFSSLVVSGMSSILGVALLTMSIFTLC